MAPFVKGEIGTDGGKACDEVVFPFLDGTLSCILSVEIRGNSLECDIVFGESGFHVIQALVF